MTHRASHQHKTRFSYNASQNRSRKHVPNQDDLESRTTASPTHSFQGLSSDSEQDWRSKADSDKDWRCCNTAVNRDQDMPPNSSTRTSLKSVQDKAKVFVPVDMPMMPPCVPSPGKDCLAGVVHGALGAELWNLNMMDYISYNGDWCTAVEITIPELGASMCHLFGSQDVEAVNAARDAHQAQVLRSLTQSLKSLEPNMELQPPPDHSGALCVEYCAADRSKLCREFSRFGECPRGGTCRWAHAMVETFVIHFILAPLVGPWDPTMVTEDPKVVPGESNLVTPVKTERWQPNRPPMLPSGVLHP
jgi:hypothetical protein